jgi:thiol-disulfide isomerase/thioredoxin
MITGRAICILVSILLMSTDRGLAENQIDAAELLKKVSETYRNLQSYHFEGITTMEVETGGMKHKMEIPVAMAAVRPGKRRAEVKNPVMEILTLSDGQTEWAYVPQLKQFTKKAAASRRSTGGENASEKGAHSRSLAAGFVDEYGHIAEQVQRSRILREEPIELEGKRIDCSVVEVVYKPDEGSAELDSSPKTLWVDKTRFIVLRESSSARIQSSALGGPVNTKQTTTLTLAKVNEPVPEALFVFKPPKGAEQVKELSLPGMPREEESRKEASDFTLKDIEGREFNLGNLRGKVVLLNFWASWCGPCREEMPFIEGLYREFKDNGLVVLGINDENPEVALEFLRENSYTFPSLVDTEGEVSEHYQVEGIPTVVIIDRTGKLVNRHVGFSPGKEQALRVSLKESGIE